MGIHRDTVSDVIEDLARHAREVTDLLIKNVGLTQIQVDEMWSFVKNDFFTKNRVKTALRAGFDFVVVHQTNKRKLNRETLDQINMATLGSTQPQNLTQNSI